MAEDVGQWLGSLPDWIQTFAIPIFALVALLFVPVGGGGDTLGTIIFDLMTRNSGEENDKK